MPLPPRFVNLQLLLLAQVAGGCTGIHRPCALKPGSVNQLLPNLRLQVETSSKVVFNCHVALNIVDDFSFFSFLYNIGLDQEETVQFKPSFC
jgi:hypothetical protein